MFIRHRRSENSLPTTKNSLAKFCSFTIILLLLYTFLLLLHFLMKTLAVILNKTNIINTNFLKNILLSLYHFLNIYRIILSKNKGT